ncbi:MAG: sigma-70 family RNA polymerase sigma factor [Oscillibacter sp.]|nr:sigma-70 family RNA polymerase sigma factor [Oscillibacter sp.]
MLVYLQAIETAEDRTRFEAMYSAYRGLMFHVANRILQNPQDAEDAVHLAFLSLANHRLPPELGPQARHLAAVTVERKAIDLYRAKRRWSEVELEEETLLGCAPPPSDGTLAGAMAALPPRYREALLLKYYNGYSAGEIGELLGTTAANVRQILARAKKKLAAELMERGEIL